MTPDEIADQLINRYQKPDFPDTLAQLTPVLNKDVILALARRLAQQQQRNAHRALRIANLTYEVARQMASDEAKGLAIWLKGNALGFLNQYREALACYQEAESFFSLEEHPTRIVGLQVNQISILCNLGEYTTALELAERARTTAAALGGEVLGYLSQLELSVGLVYMHLGNFKEALAAYDRGHILLKEIGDPIQMAFVDGNRAVILQGMGRFSQAERLLHRARDVLAQHQYDQEVARVDNNLGELAYFQGRYQAALYHLENARNGFASIPLPVEMAVVDLDRSFVYRQLNLWTETITLAAAAEQAMRKSHYSHKRAQALISQGLGFQKLGQLINAEKYFNKARRIFRRIGAGPGLLQLDVDRAYLALERRRIPRARRIGRRIVKQIDVDEYPTLMARLHVLLSWCALLHQPRPQLSLAHEQAQAAQEVAITYRLRELEIQAFQLLGRIAEQKGEEAMAQSYYEQALQVVDEMRATLLSDEFQVSFMDDKVDLYQDMVRLCHRKAHTHQKEIPHLLATLNRASLAPLRHLTPSMEEPHSPDEVEAAEDLGRQLAELRQRWHWYQNQLEAEQVIAPQSPHLSPQALRQKLTRIEGEIKELTSRQRVQQVGVSALQRPDEPAVVKDATFVRKLQVCLRVNDILINYYVVEGMCQALLIDKEDTALVVDLVSVEQVERVLRAWRFHIDQFVGELDVLPSPTAALPYLKRLHQLLVQPLTPFLDRVPYDHIYLLMPPNWHDLPFAACFDGQHYLVEKYSLTYLSALSALLTASVPAQAEPLRDTPVALVVGYSNDGSLPQTVVEARQVVDALGETWEAVLFTEQTATMTNVRTAVSGSHLLHFATHARFRPGNPLFSWIRLADDRLTVADIYTLTLPKRPLVVLSACETGRGQSRGGGLLGMGRGFLAAGASSVIVSLWRLEDRFSSQLMSHFYGRLTTQPLSQAQSLCLAQRELLQEEIHPCFWAGYIFIAG